MLSSFPRKRESSVAIYDVRYFVLVRFRGTNGISRSSDLLLRSTLGHRFLAHPFLTPLAHRFLARLLPRPHAGSLRRRQRVAGPGRQFIGIVIEPFGHAPV